MDGIRGIAEVETFKKEFGDEFLLVNIEAPLEVRYERIKSRGREDDLLSLEEFKKREAREKGWGMGDAMKIAARIIKNENTIDEFKEELKEFLQQYKHTQK